MTRSYGDENLKKKKKKKKKKKSTVFLLFCVSVGSFCDELTVVFHLFVRFLLIHELFLGVGGKCWGSFSFFPRLSGPDVGEAGETQPRKEEHENDLHDRKGRKRLLFFFLNHFLYMLVPENTDIYGKWFFT